MECILFMNLRNGKCRVWELLSIVYFWIYKCWVDNYGVEQEQYLLNSHCWTVEMSIKNDKRKGAGVENLIGSFPKRWETPVVGNTSVCQIKLFEFMGTPSDGKEWSTKKYLKVKLGPNVIWKWFKRCLKMPSEGFRAGD